jgi:hypothetical protein
MGLWANVFVSLLAPINATAQDHLLRSIASNVDSLERLSSGTCTNSKLC